jgi:predicted AlkP superfamily phosphohydrolase/phosphomutase
MDTCDPGRARGVRTGDHKPDGLLLAAGHGIRPGRLARSIPVMDLAPTMAALLGVQLRHVDGVPIEALLAHSDG